MTTPTQEAQRLGLQIVDRGGIMVVAYEDGGCHPASRTELSLWNALQAALASAQQAEPRAGYGEFAKLEAEMQASPPAEVVAGRAWVAEQFGFEAQQAEPVGRDAYVEYLLNMISGMSAANGRLVQEIGRISAAQQAAAELERLRAEVEAKRANAERYEWLRKRLFGADWDWNGEGVSVAVFKWPENAAIGADLDTAIDTARSAQEPAKGGER